MYWIKISLIFSAHGFGINTNILETNIINLAVVISIVFSFVGDLVKDLLITRKKTILQNICTVNDRVKEIEEKMNHAQLQLETAKKKSIEIREQGLFSAEQEKQICLKQTEEETQRLKQAKLDTIRLTQQKTIEQISQKIIIFSLKQVREKLLIKMKSRTFQPWVNQVKIKKYTSIKLFSKPSIS